MLDDVIVGYFIEFLVYYKEREIVLSLLTIIKAFDELVSSRVEISLDKLILGLGKKYAFFVFVDATGLIGVDLIIEYVELL